MQRLFPPVRTLYETRHVDTGVEYGDVKRVELSIGALGERLNTRVRRHVELPYHNFAIGVDELGTDLDRGFGGEAFVDGANAQDKLGGAELGEFEGGFETQAGVRACDEDGLVGESFGRRGVGRWTPFVPVDCGEEGHDSGGQSIS